MEPDASRRVMAGHSALAAALVYNGAAFVFAGLPADFDAVTFTDVSKRPVIARLQRALLLQPHSTGFGPPCWRTSHESGSRHLTGLFSAMRDCNGELSLRGR